MSLNEHQSMTLFCQKQDLASQQIALTLLEKEMVFKVEFVEAQNLPESLLAQAFLPKLPMLQDRDLVLFDVDIILSYLDERIPAPALMPIMPKDRARFKMAIHQIHFSWMRDFAIIQTGLKTGRSKSEKQLAQEAKARLTDELTANSLIFTETDYFLNDQFSLCDCYFAPLLMRLDEIQLTLPQSAQKNYGAYQKRILDRAAFVESNLLVNF